MNTDTLEKSADANEKWFSDDAATFGDRLAAAREASGLSQADLAQRLGVKTRVIEHWEADAKEPRANRLQMLAGMLGVSLMWLLTGEGDGIEGPGETDTEAAQVKGVLAEIRELRAAMSAMTGRLGRLEKKLRQGAAGKAA
ncbi:helix-turn-helix domain-containing protein [Defluviimonas sp. WL0024]|uniref:Helix-turn-helix domain-containing protein n=2 Tax=Albidovulum TaxID=205889 RepID=A0ABT3J2P4_9RHOB|nr:MULTISPECIES: helix-turn-helix transcriptional regulator [Defluviimonas]MCU9847623.1 helix-turn-helix domain-containing protein [Defluviimonas sp. WL0024]MCW3781949.1 helix-turn-helix domain-containing protein [Defluviimonas salinarum]